MALRGFFHRHSSIISQSTRRIDSRLIQIVLPRVIATGAIISRTCSESVHNSR